MNQGDPWQSYMAAGGKAYQQSNYPEVEKQLVAAVKEAEGFGPQDPRLGDSLNNLAVLYHAQDKHAEAEPLYQRSLAIVEKALGPDHPHVPTSLENYAVLLRETGRSAQAAKMEARAKAIRVKQAKESPAK